MKLKEIAIDPKKINDITAADSMRIGYVLKRYPRYSETFIVNEILAHEAAGMEIEIFSLRPPTDTHFQDALARVRAPVTYLPYHGIETQEFWKILKKTGRDFSDFWGILAAFKDENHHDIYQALLIAQAVLSKGIHRLHAHFATSATTVARLAALIADIPFTFTAHAKDIFHESVQWQDLQKKIMDTAQVITVSDYNVNYLKEKFPVSPSKITRIYNGLDLQRFSFRTQQKASNRILAVGRLVEKKGFADLVEACAIMDRSGLNFQCGIAGSGPEEAHLQQLIEKSGLLNKVKLLGPLPQQEIIQEMQKANIFVAPCVVGTDGNRDGLPTVLLEAMALGIPCISTNVTGIPEVLKDNETGVMVPQHHPTALAAAMEELLKNSALQLKLAVRARELIEMNFDIDKNTARMREVFTASQGKKGPALQEID